MSRYTPKRLPLSAGGGPARPKKPARRGKPDPTAKKPSKKPVKTGAFACKICGRKFRTQEAVATHALDAHAEPVDLKALAPLSPSMVRCPDCGAPVGKRNLAAHRRMIHGSNADEAADESSEESGGE